jgi:hypothetical protein
MEVSGKLHAPVALSPGKNPCYPLDRRLGGPQSRSGLTLNRVSVCELDSSGSGYGIVAGSCEHGYEP